MHTENHGTNTANNLYPEVNSVNNRSEHQRYQTQQRQEYRPYPQQGYQPPHPNQGFNPQAQPPYYQNQNAPYQPPNYYPPPPPVQAHIVPVYSYQAMIPGSRLMCPFCRRETDNIPRKVAGGVTWIWCFALFLLTGICCCVPFCVDSCQDTQLICVSCQGVKARIEANCC